MVLVHAPAVKVFRFDNNPQLLQKELELFVQHSAGGFRETVHALVRFQLYAFIERVLQNRQFGVRVKEEIGAGKVGALFFADWDRSSAMICR
jgi:hypothetical protein